MRNDKLKFYSNKTILCGQHYVVFNEKKTTLTFLQSLNHIFNIFHMKDIELELGKRQ